MAPPICQLAIHVDVPTVGLPPLIHHEHDDGRERHRLGASKMAFDVGLDLPRPDPRPPPFPDPSLLFVWCESRYFSDVDAVGSPEIGRLDENLATAYAIRPHFSLREMQKPFEGTTLGLFSTRAMTAVSCGSHSMSSRRASTSTSSIALTSSVPESLLPARRPLSAHWIPGEFKMNLPSRLQASSP